MIPVIRDEREGKMRDIKFRLRIDNRMVGYEKWYLGERVNFTANPCWLYSKDQLNWFPKYIYHTHKDEFTGLKDKNGKEVYEGDIVLQKGLNGETNDIAEVLWSQRNIGFEAQFKASKLNLPLAEFIEIIGNRFENPELLGDRK